MKSNTWVMVFFAILFIVLIVSILKPVFSPTGRAVEFIEELCTENSDCADYQICCYFSGQSSGVCDYQESCAAILETTDKEYLPDVQQPISVNSGGYYGILIALLVTVIVLIFIFYKKAR